MFSIPVCFPQALATDYTGQMFQLLPVFIFLCIYLFLAGPCLHCCAGFSLVVSSGGDSWLQCWGFSLWWPLRSWSTGSRVCGLQQLWHMSSVLWCMGLVALRHFGSSRTRDQTHISCIGQAGSLPLSQ